MEKRIWTWFHQTGVYTAGKLEDKGLRKVVETFEAFIVSLTA
ncbi:hypothetical protein [Kosmotoga pacifica]|nr:hypothetical protein [Kosmotoga pacifica]